MMKTQNDDSKISQIKVDGLDAIQPLGRHLILLFRAFEQELLEELTGRGFQDITGADLQILRFVKPEGSHAVEIAELLGITKQGVGKAVLSLEERGYVKRKADPHDVRAKLIIFTSSGKKLIGEAIAFIETIEARYEALIGEQPFQTLKAQLRTLFNDHQMRKT
jgi:DNA-binding MarR family transcriptional regulator